MKQKKPASNILSRIQEAKDDKDWGELSYILEEATENDVNALKNMNALKSVILEFIEHHDWIVRASTVELIGRFLLNTFLNLVKARLQDRNFVVRSYALMAYYELIGTKALPAIEECCSSGNVEHRVTALALHYIEKRDDDSFKKLSKILKRKGCNINHLYSTLYIFDYYFDVQQHREIIKFFEDALKDIPKSLCIAKDINIMLNKWKKPREKQIRS